MLDLYFSYDAPIMPRFHKCGACKRNLSEVPPQRIVCGAEDIVGAGSAPIRVRSWYCNKDCARAAYHAPRAEEMDALNRYIKEGGR